MDIVFGEMLSWIAFTKQHFEPNVCRNSKYFKIFILKTYILKVIELNAYLKYKAPFKQSVKYKSKIYFGSIHP